MAFEVPMDDIDTETIGGFDKVAPGSFHTEIVDIDEEGGKKGEMIVKLEILRGTTANQEGKYIPIYFAREMTDLARRKVHALALATGLIDKKGLELHKKNGTSPSYDFTTTVGRQVCVNLENNEWNGKHSTRLAWDEIYHPTDKRANHIPLNVAKLAAAKIVLPAGRNPDGAVKTGGQSDGGKKAETTAKPEPSKQAASVDELLAG